MWEDENNKLGGKFILRVRKTLTNRLWEALVLAVTGGQFSGDLSNEICGCVVSIRHGEDSISLWHRSSKNFEVRNQLQLKLKEVLELPADVNFEYKNHDVSLVHLQTMTSAETRSSARPNPRAPEA